MSRRQRQWSGWSDGSGLEPRLAMASLAPVAAQVAAPRAWAGEINGVHRQLDTNIPDLGTLYELRGKGRLNGAGFVRMNGQLQTTDIAGSGPSAYLTIRNERGTVRLTLRAVKGTDDVEFGRPLAFSYRMSNGTGAYRNANGRGLASLTLEPQNVRCAPGTECRPQGDLNLRLIPGAVA